MLSTPAHAAPPDPAPLPDDVKPEASTLGQTPHEPAVRPWEMELLVSGAVVFAMVQVPAQISEWFVRMSPRLDIAALAVLAALTYYGRVIVWTLVVAFLVQLAVRAYWVGLIGVESVFPHGVRWEQARFGPVMRDVYRERTPSLQALIDRADRFASLIFGFAFSVVLVLAFGVLVSAVMGALAYGISTFLLGGRWLLPLYGVLLLCVMMPGMVVWALDRTLSPRLAEDAPGRRAIRRVGIASYWMSMSWLYAGMMQTLFTNLPRRRMSVAFIAATVALLGFATLQDRRGGSGTALDGYRYLPDEPAARGEDPAYYQDQRAGGDLYRPVPSIQSDIITDPYVRLFIPYAPLNHNAAIAKRCPGVRLPGKGAPANDAGMQALLDCMARLQPMTLNGRPVAPRFRFTTDAATGLRGMVAHLPVAGLPRGENVLVIQRLPPRRRLRGPPRPPYYVPFWL